MYYSRIRKEAGFSMIEVMLSITISLLSLVLLLNILQIFKRNADQVNENAFNQIKNTNLISFIERDIRMAGYGFMPLEIIGCNLKRYYQKKIDPLLLRPIEIKDGENGTYDSIRIMYSTKNKPNIPTIIIKELKASNTMLTNNSLEIKPNDFLVVHEKGSDCSLLQVTGIDSEKIRISFENERSPWNSATFTDVFPSVGYPMYTSLTNLGEMADITYSLNSLNQFEKAIFVSSNNSFNKQVVNSDIINFQAQYGFDARDGEQASPMVTKWSSKMLDINKDSIVGNSADIKRILAIRIALVSRNRNPELPVNGVCSTSNSPNWMASNETSGELEPTNIDVSKNTDKSEVPNWACYQYKVMQSVIPIKNLIWSE
jgi:type IV pilus assembly protein PilW